MTLFTESEKREIAKLYKEGKSTRLIADEMFSNHETIRCALIDMDIERRLPNFQSGYGHAALGDKNFHWKGGKRSYWGRIAEAVLIKAGIDLWTCMECGELILENAHIHHVDGDKSNNDVTNLEVLCAKHHVSTDPKARHRKTWDSAGRFISWEKVHAKNSD